MKIAIGADHRGFKHKNAIQDALPLIVWVDVGAYDQQRSDYPIFAKRVCQAIQFGSVQSGVLLCATGVGMAIAANRYKKIYAALAWTVEVAIKSKEHDAANVLVIPSDFVSCAQAVSIIQSWLQASFYGKEYRSRVYMIDENYLR